MKSKTKTKFSIFYLIAAMALYGCAMYNNIYANYDQSVDFTKYKTYAWLNSQKTTPYYNDVIENNAKNHVDLEFKNRGYVVDTINPDVLLELELKSENKKEEVQTTNPYNYSNYTYYNYPYNHHYNDNLYYGNQYYNGYTNYNYSIPYSYYSGYRPRTGTTTTTTTTTTTKKYTQSTITINVIDRTTNKLVWTGSAEGTIYDPQHLKDEIHPALNKILEQYPTKPIKNQ